MRYNDAQDHEQRRARRKPAHPVAMATDTITGLPFGRVGNLSSNGMLLISPIEPCSEAIYQLSLPLPSHDGVASIEVGVQEQWHERATATGQVWAGFRIVSISEQDTRRLDAWLALPD